MKKITANLVALTLLATAAFGDDITDAFAAYDNKEYKKAFELFNQICDAGDSSGCQMLGAIYEDGYIVEKNVNEALAYYTKACDMGRQDGCESYIKLQAKLPVCNENEISFVDDKRYFEIASNDNFPLIVGDSQTIQIDRKKKMITIWTAQLSSEKLRQEYITKYGERFSDFGYVKYLNVIDYQSMRNYSKSYAEYKCDGSIIETGKLSNEWRDTIPGSTMEVKTKSIMKKYNLK